MSDGPKFDELLTREFRWPRQGDKPFTQSAQWQDNATIAEDHHGRMVMMITGYKCGADLMVERTRTDPYDRTSLVYPILFSYRQFIELSLKYLISTYGPTVDIDAIWNTHDLSSLWRTFVRVLDGYGRDDADETDPIVADIVAEFAKVDPRSFSYRYPVDTRGMPIPLDHDELDLACLADVMRALDGYFNGCDGYLDALKSAEPLSWPDGC